MGDDTQQPLAGTVLVADDEDGIRDIACQILESKGYRVITAMDGQEALAQLEKYAGEIGCIVLDFAMPRMNGDQVLEEIIRRNLDIPVIFCSGSPVDDFKPTVDRARIRGFLRKPYAMGELVSLIARSMK